MEYIRYKDLDLSSTSNSKRCRRSKNQITSVNDQLIGSTIGGKFGYGYATNSLYDNSDPNIGKDKTNDNKNSSVETLKDN